LKKTLSCLTKCCHAGIKTHNARRSTTQQYIRATMRIVRENAAPAIVNIEGSTCAASVFVIIAFNELRARDTVATHRCRSKARCADSESQFLAMKKFSCSPASRRIGTRQNQFFPRIAAADSQSHFGPRDASTIVAGDQCTLACRSSGDDAAPRRATFRCRVWT
jgi:hypothetical protein